MLKNSNSKAQTNGNNNYEDAKLEDSNEALKKSFSTSVRTKTIIVFVILVIVFILLTSYSFSKGSPSALSGYERKVANAEIRGLLNNIRSQLNILLVIIIIKTTITVTPFHKNLITLFLRNSSQQSPTGTRQQKPWQGTMTVTRHCSINTGRLCSTTVASGWSRLLR